MVAFPSSRLALAVLVPFLGLASANGQESGGGLRVEEPWARASIGVSRPGAVYLTVRNDGATDDILVAVETPAAHMADLHTTEVKDGIASMTPVEALPIPAGGEATLAPGGVHVMLMMLTAPLEEGGSLLLTLVFERAGRIDVTVPVYGVGARGPNE